MITILAKKLAEVSVGGLKRNAPSGRISVISINDGGRHLARGHVHDPPLRRKHRGRQ